MLKQIYLILKNNKKKSINNYKSMIDEGIQTEPKIIEQDESPEKDYSFLKEQNKIDNQFLNKKRK